METKKNRIDKDFKELVKPFLESYTNSLLTEFVKENLVKVVSKKADTEYQLNLEKSIGIIKTPTFEKNIFKELIELRSLVRNVYNNLNFADSEKSQDYSFSKLMINLSQKAKFNISGLNDRETKNILDKLDDLVGDDPIIIEEIANILNKYKLNLTRLSFNILEYYGKEKAIKYFSSLNYKYNREAILLEKSKFDLILQRNEIPYPSLLFNFIYRKTAILNDETIRKEIINLEKLINSNSNRFHCLVVVFTQEDNVSFERLKLNYKNLVKKTSVNEIINSKLHIIPISLSSLHLIDREFLEFKQEYIEEDIQFKFTNQVPPKRRSNRNDHFVDRIFNFKMHDFEITVNPLDTQYWRLGLKFGRNERFPDIDEERHNNPNFGDFVITVGNLKAIENRQTWVEPNNLNITVYNLEIVKDDFNEYFDYERSGVHLLINSNDSGELVDFEIRIKNKVIGKKTLNLFKYNYCKIYAWSDYNTFNLDSHIYLKHKQ